MSRAAAEALFDRIVPVVKAHLPPGMSQDDLAGFLMRWHTPLVEMLAQGLEAREQRLRATRLARGTSVIPTAAGELRGSVQRTNANLAAMTLAATKGGLEMTAEDRRVLKKYSGWGGLSLEAAQDRFDRELPADFPRPERRGLIHEYYTPTVVAEAVARNVGGLLGSLPVDPESRRVLALEPSAGIGRFLKAFDAPAFSVLDWRAVEWSALSSRMLGALYPGLDLFHGPFERWVRERGGAVKGRLGLVVANPPYGPRGAAVAEDAERSYREKAAYAYFLRRCLDLLAPNGLGVFLVPAGFLTGKSTRHLALRQKVLLRHHLSAAYRLPSVGTDGREALFPGAMLVTDLLFFRARGGTLPEVPEGDRFVWEGRYFEQFPAHILGRELGDEQGEDDQTAKPRFGYQVQGEFTGLPKLVEREFCATCVVQDAPPAAKETPKAPRRGLLAGGKDAKGLDGLSDELRAAVTLGLRVDRYLSEPVGSLARVQLWKELIGALGSWVSSHGSPWRHAGLLKLSQKGTTGAERFLAAFERGQKTLIEGLRSKPRHEPPYKSGKDVGAMARHLYAVHRKLPVSELTRFWTAQGYRGAPDLGVLFGLGWCLDGEGMDQLVPEEVYLTGHLWPKLDRASAHTAASAREQVADQVRRLTAAIGPVPFEDIAVSPRDGWVPLNLLHGWMSAAFSDPYGRSRKLPALERRQGLLQFEGREYESYSTRIEAVWCLGWVNHDNTLFKPSYSRNSGETIDQKRVEYARKWDASFRAWLAADEERKAAIEAVYNRQFKGWVAPTFTAEPLTVARWDNQRIQPHPHQVAAARRLLTNRGGLLAFDVGVGKTYTGLLTIARARQEGWCKRPVIVVPNSIIWKWAADVERVLPDYRFAVVGSRRKVITRGSRKGQVTSEPDTPEQRARKWTRFQAGEYDLVLITYSALGRTRVNEDALRGYADQVEAIQREIRLRQRNARGSKKLSERQEAVLSEGVAAWLAEKLELPKGWAYDPGIVWDDLGVDLLMVDEAQNFKNLYLPEAREGGVPRFMGNAGEGSQRAWQLDFRCAEVRRYTGGTGIVLLSATPAKNSPLEFYNLLQMVDPTAFTGMGIRDPEQFIDRYLKVELRQVVDSKMDVVEKGAVVGFQNLHELRDTLHRYSEFKTAEDVGLKLPEPTVRVIEVEMNAAQEAKYAQYVAQIQDALDNPDPQAKTAILGLLTRMALVAIHPALDEGYDWKSAASAAVNPRSPKFEALAKEVLTNRTCGHIVFVDNVAAHRWVVKVLAAAGIPEKRIAVLNAKTASPADRQRIAREFNGVPDEDLLPKYDVVIANAVAYEGIDLQTRTCAIHHLDLPWEPATLQQRNGRGVRQGNTLSAIEINYYFALRSSDGLRFNLIQGKRGWMVSLLKSQDRDTNNPGAQQDMGPEEALLLISRDPEATRKKLEKLKAKKAEDAKKKLAEGASRLLRGANSLFRKADRTGDPAEAERLRREAESRLLELEKVDPAAWPWLKWAWKARELPVLHAPDGLSPVFHEGLRVAYAPSAVNPDHIEHFELGRIHGETIGLRRAGSSGWDEQTLEVLARLGTDGAGLRPEHLDPTSWPENDAVEADADLPRRLRSALAYSGHWPGLKWHLAPDAWTTRAWARTGPDVLQHLATVRSWYLDGQHVPALVGDRLVIRRGADLLSPEVGPLPPTEAGWRAFLEHAPASELRFTDLETAGQWWWSRRIPRDLLSAAQKEVA